MAGRWSKNHRTEWRIFVQQAMFDDSGEHPRTTVFPILYYIYIIYIIYILYYIYVCINKLTSVSPSLSPPEAGHADAHVACEFSDVGAMADGGLQEHVGVVIRGGLFQKPPWWREPWNPWGKEMQVLVMESMVKFIIIHENHESNGNLWHVSLLSIVSCCSLQPNHWCFKNPTPAWWDRHVAVQWLKQSLPLQLPAAVWGLWWLL